MENPIPYQEWPKWVKLATAINIKSTIPRDAQTIKFISGLNVALGLYLFFSFEQNTLMYEYSPPRLDHVDLFMVSVGFFGIFFGLLSGLFVSKAYDWIQKNSSWEERFIHRSSPENKRSFFAILVGMVFLSYLLAKLFQYYKEMV